MKYIIIGNGAAGSTAAKKIRSLDNTAQIMLVSDEPALYYPRPRLPEFIEEKITIEELLLYKTNWYSDKNIDLHINEQVIKIDPSTKSMSTTKNSYSYDRLLLAVGSEAFLPPLPGNTLAGVFTLRTLADAKRIKEYSHNKKEIIAIGGGLLGLELANCFANGKRIVNVIEIFDYLLPRQLKKEQGLKLQQKLENKAFVFHLNERCKEIQKIDEKLIITTASGKLISGDMIVISAGARPRLTLAQKAKLKTNKGIIVNQFLETSEESIYAAGDCIEYNETLWGFVKSSVEQGSIAAQNMVKPKSAAYTGSTIEPVLKISDIDLTTL